MEYRVRLQERSFLALHILVHEFSGSLQNFHEEMFQVISIKGILTQLYDIEVKLRTLQCTKDPIHVLYVIIGSLGRMIGTDCNPTNEWEKKQLLHKLTDDKKEIIHRAELMHERTDSVWLLYADSEWLLSAVQNILQFELSETDGAQQFSPNQQGSQQLLHKFTDRLQDWQKVLEKQKRLFENLSVMIRSWPEYPRVRSNFIVHQK